MKSSERREARYKRRKEKRNSKLIDASNYYADIDRAFSFSIVRYYANKVCNGVRYKTSTKNFELHKFSIIATTCKEIKTGTYVVHKAFHFTINERGKSREIDAPHIKDRLVHKVLANEVINPLYSPHLIYDNGASMEGKGFKFALDRVNSKLKQHYSKYGFKGYVVFIDYSKFFENINHEIVHEIHKKYIYNDYVVKIVEDYLFIVKGLALGVEIAQREACMCPNKLDHFLQNNNALICRYMDDSLFIVNSLEKAHLLLEEYYKLCDKLHITINKNKTKIIPFGNKFLFCKWYFLIDNNGRVIRYPDYSTIYRQRRKLKKMKKHNINTDEILVSKTAFIAYLNHGNSYKYIEYLNNRF